MTRPQGRPVVDAAQYPCGHVRSDANTVVRQSRGGVSKACRRCEQARNRAYMARPEVKALKLERQRLRRAAKSAQHTERVSAQVERRKPYIVPTSAWHQQAMAEAQAMFDRAMEARPRRGRPRTQRPPTSEAAA